MLFKYADFDNGSSDLELYFKNSLVRLIGENGKAEWFTYEGCNPEGFRLCRGKGRKDCCMHIDPKTFAAKFQIDVRYPVGFFNTEDSVVFIERTGMRQNIKGLKNHSIGLTAMEKIAAEAIMWPEKIDSSAKWAEGLNNKVPLTPEFCNAVLENPTYFELDEAKGSIRSGKAFARALSPSLALVPHHQTDDFLIFRDWLPIGEFLSKNRVRVLVPEMRPELVDFFAPRGIKFIAEKSKQ